MNPCHLVLGATYKAWMIPGMYPRTVKRMLMKKSALQPRSRKTPRGGRTMARIILQMSLQAHVSDSRVGCVGMTYDAVKGMLSDVLWWYDIGLGRRQIRCGQLL